METLGDRIKHFRNLKGFSQKELADRAGVTQPVIAELEKNRQKTTKAVFEIARALEVTVADLQPDLNDLLDEVYAPPSQDEKANKEIQCPEQAIALAEGAMLAAGLDPSLLGALRQLLLECLEEPVVASTPQSALESRRTLTRSVVSRFLREHGEPDGQE